MGLLNKETLESKKGKSKNVLSRHVQYLLRYVQYILLEDGPLCKFSEPRNLG